MKSEFRFNPKDVLQEFDEFLVQHKLKFKATLIGSGALHLLGIEKVATVDLDILEPGIPPRLKELSEIFRKRKIEDGWNLRPNWFSDGAAVFLKHYPRGWKNRTQIVFKGKALSLRAFGREELIKEKLWGFCEDRRRDLLTLVRLKPTERELKQAAKWVEGQAKTIPFWSEIVDRKLKEALRRLSDEA
ncbi:MAG: hypothetical protein EA369_08585 [Bradymonadales bacterium]|nr:MAG: hypothetical protein EA369_08585 [Bradymonadales bacterium]